VEELKELSKQQQLGRPMSSPRLRLSKAWEMQ